MKIIDTLMIALGSVLLLIALSIASVGYIWHLVKPTVENTELQYYKDLHDRNTTME